MRVLVTGATGFIGGHLVDDLLEHGYQVAALVRDRSRAQHLAEAGVELVEGDVTHREALPGLMQGVDAVFHLAALYDVGGVDAARAHAVNVEGTRNVLDAMVNAGVDRGVYTSTLAINSDTEGRVVDETYTFEGQHLSVYDRTKAHAHRVAEQAIDEGLDLTIVMPGVVYGPGDTSPMAGLWTGYLTGKLPMIPYRSAYCWGHVEDTARAHRLALEEGDPGETYIIAGPPHTLVEAFQISEGITGIEAPRVVPPWVFRWMSRVMAPIAALVDVPDEYQPETLRVMAGATYLGDSTKARSQLGFDPRPLEDGLEEPLAALAEELGLKLRF